MGKGNRAIAEFDLKPFGDRHLDAAVRLMQKIKWPHRREDLAYVVKFSDGFALEHDAALIGMALCISYEAGAAGLSMIVVDEQWRGQGLGKKLFAAGVDLAGPRETRLFATADGLPLYEKFGFVGTGEVHQYQGTVQAAVDQVPPSGRVRWSTPEDLSYLADLDRQATALDRHSILLEFGRLGRFAVLTNDGRTSHGFAGFREFGRGFVIGPVVAANQADAQELIAFLMARLSGSFCRVDTYPDLGLPSWLEEWGLEHVDTVVPMTRNGAKTTEDRGFHSFALISQAFG